MDVESFESGYVAAILAKAGEATPVGAPCALLVDNEADIEKVKAALAGGASISAPAAAAAPAAPPAAAASSNAPTKPSFAFAEVAMPALSSTMTSGKIVAWTAKVGDTIKAGQTVMVCKLPSFTTFFSSSSPCLLMLSLVLSFLILTTHQSTHLLPL